MTLDSLPSEDAVRRMLAGEPGGVQAVVGTTLSRGLIISLCLLLVRVPTTKAFLGGLVSAAAIEAFVIANTVNESRKQPTP